MVKDTKAIAAHKQSISSAMAGDKQTWLANFAEDAVVHDPVGKSPHDPEGLGFRGKGRIEEFWDTVIAPGDLTIVPHKRYPCGDSVVAVAMTITNHFSGVKSFTEMIATYETNEDGKLASLKVYWDVDAMMAQFS